MRQCVKTGFVSFGNTRSKNRCVCCPGNGSHTTKAKYLKPGTVEAQERRLSKKP